MIFLVTNQCNARCRHCFLYATLNQSVSENLSLGEIHKFFSSAGRIKSVVIGGGEPFLRPDVGRICVTIAQAASLQSLTIATNGSMGDAIVDTAKAILEQTNVKLIISFSLDGPPKLHEEIRGIPGLYERMKETYARLSMLHDLFYPRLAFQINMVVFQDTYATFFETYGLAKSDFPLARFSFEVMRGTYDSRSAQPITHAMYRELIAKIRARKGSEMEDIVKLHETAVQCLEQKRQVVSCIAGDDFVVLDSSGNMGLCELLPTTINIRDKGYDFSRVRADARWRAARNRIKQNACYCSHLCFLSASLDKDSDERTRGA